MKNRFSRIMQSWSNLESEIESLGNLADEKLKSIENERPGKDLRRYLNEIKTTNMSVLQINLIRKIVILAVQAARARDGTADNAMILSATAELVEAFGEVPNDVMRMMDRKASGALFDSWTRLSELLEKEGILKKIRS